MNVAFHPDGPERQIEAAIRQAQPISSDDAPMDLKLAGLKQRDALLLICDEAAVWRTPEGDTFASVPVNGHVEHHAVGSRSFREWMLHRLACRFSDNGRSASAGDNAVKDARNAVEARGLVAKITYNAVLRIAEHDGAMFLDLGTTDWSAMQVTAEGWQIVPRPPLPILRSKRAAPFAVPAESGDFAPLRRLLAHLDEDTFILLVAWCLGALLPAGPYPILILGGEQGAGKSTLARLAQRLTDPIHGDLLQPPGDDRDLIAAARSNRVLSFDNLSSVSAELADSLCRLSTGSEIGGRALYTDHDTASFTASRPLVLNGIPDLAARGDLADRAIVLRLPSLPGRMTERDWRAAVEAVLPATFAGLLDALSHGLGALEATPTPNLRMADFARFIVAAEPALPWPAGAFLAALERSRLDATSALADGDMVASAVRAFMKRQRGDWTGLMSELHKALSNLISTEDRRSGQWPRNPRWLGDRLRRAAPTLRAIGIDFSERRSASGALVTLARIASPATPAAQGQAPVGSGKNAASAASAAIRPLSEVADRGKSPAMPDSRLHQPNGSSVHLRHLPEDFENNGDV